MHGNYIIKDGKISYKGNKVFPAIDDVSESQLDGDMPVSRFAESEHYERLHRIDNAVFMASVDYFRGIGADWANLPLITKMISSPGEVYAGDRLDYTTDALPVSLDWFGKKVFLAESSQFYLEMRLLIDNLDKVFSIYNSFRKETADFSHLSEFQHIEFEGRVSFEENIDIAVGLMRHITEYILKNNIDDLRFYLEDDEIDGLAQSFDSDRIKYLTFKEAMGVLRRELRDPTYDEVSLKNFGAFEEVALTNIVGGHCIVTHYPVEQIPFYHDESFTDEDGVAYARNADIILHGYREVVGSGQRIESLDSIRKKAEFFNLPPDDYAPYIQMREMASYRTTCGFGMGWQRYTQWLLKLPHIWDSMHIPRGHVDIKL